MDLGAVAASTFELTPRQRRRFGADLGKSIKPLGKRGPCLMLKEIYVQLLVNSKTEIKNYLKFWITPSLRHGKN